MDHSVQDKVAVFDTLFTTNQIRKLKVLISFVDHRWQRHLAVYIKYLELQYVLSNSRHFPFRLKYGHDKDEKGDFQSLITALIPYSNERDRKQLEQFAGMFQTMEMFQQLAPMMDLMKNIMPDMADSGGMMGALSSMFGNMNAGGKNQDSAGNEDMMMNMLMGMMTAEQKEMYEKFYGEERKE